jgi:hypothetical protein
MSISARQLSKPFHLKRVLYTLVKPSPIRDVTNCDLIVIRNEWNKRGLFMLQHLVSIDIRNFKGKSDPLSVELPHPVLGQGHKQLINLSVQPSNRRVPFQRAIREYSASPL